MNSSNCSLSTACWVAHPANIARIVSHLCSCEVPAPLYHPHLVSELGVGLEACVRQPLLYSWYFNTRTRIKSLCQTHSDKCMSLSGADHLNDHERPGLVKPQCCRDCQPQPTMSVLKVGIATWGTPALAVNAAVNACLISQQSALYTNHVKPIRRYRQTDVTH